MYNEYILRKICQRDFLQAKSLALKEERKIEEKIGTGNVELWQTFEEIAEEYKVLPMFNISLNW